jgi:peroxiredoxin
MTAHQFNAAAARVSRWHPRRFSGILKGMAMTASTLELALGSAAPDFALHDALGKKFTLADFQPAPALVVVFACNHCPYVLHLARELGELAREYERQGVRFVGINSNDPAAYPADAAELMPAFSLQYGWDFPYLVDETQEVAKAYYAACTPDFYAFDGAGKLAYAGQFDSSRPKNGQSATGADLRAALEAILDGREVPQTAPSAGCNIKWRPGNAPAYYG